MLLRKSREERNKRVRRNAIFGHLSSLSNTHNNHILFILRIGKQPLREVCVVYIQDKTQDEMYLHKSSTCQIENSIHEKMFLLVSLAASSSSRVRCCFVMFFSFSFCYKNIQKLTVCAVSLGLATTNSTHLSLNDTHCWLIFLGIFRHPKMKNFTISVDFFLLFIINGSSVVYECVSVLHLSLFANNSFFCCAFCVVMNESARWGRRCNK